MLISKNASSFQLHAQNAPVFVYGAGTPEPLFFDAIQDALNPAHYREKFYPFAYVILDKKTGEFVLVRDHLGVQPLYYTYQTASKTLVFGETLPDILAALREKPVLLDAATRGEFIEPREYTDKTLYQGIYRVEPGHMLHGTPDGKCTKKAFWQLAREGETLYYKDSRDYLAHFSALMDSAIQDATRGYDNIAAEFSAGVDSTAVYLASMKRGLDPTLYMHAATKGSHSEEKYNTSPEKAFFSHYQPKTSRIYADDFDLLKIAAQYAGWFAGPPSYIFEVFAHPLHRAVAKGGHKILLSGFGGDQGVSGHVPPRYILPELLKQRAFKTAFDYLSHLSWRRRIQYLIHYAHPVSHRWMQRAYDCKAHLFNLFKPEDKKQIISIYPQQRGYFDSLREVEWQLLQGSMSHEIRMRIESSSIVAKKMGFEYRYPLLHPNLLDFYLSLPIREKRDEHAGRYIIRRYLSQFLPASVFDDDYHKKTGLNILPATMDAYKSKFLAGVFDEPFDSLPYPELIQDDMPHFEMVKSVRAFMLKLAIQADFT